MSKIFFSHVNTWLLDYQQSLISMLENEDNHKTFMIDDWSYDEVGSNQTPPPSSTGGGKTCVLSDGDVFESAGVNFSSIGGKHLPKAATDKRPELANQPFKAVGVSVVIHPYSPMIPTCHANFRFLTVGDRHWWFGGGFDLTPYYGFVSDCVAWHRAAKSVCDPYGKDVYPRFKQWCDDYFYLPHRQEPRGIGGLFFDDLNEWPFEACFAFVQDAAKIFHSTYQLIVQERKQLPYTEAQKAFQLYRRGRYVEFNLLYDRGTRFGLESNGRTESILMSLPPNVRWAYDYQAPVGSPESAFYESFLKPRDWANLCDDQSAI